MKKQYLRKQILKKIKFNELSLVNHTQFLTDTSSRKFLGKATLNGKSFSTKVFSYLLDVKKGEQIWEANLDWFLYSYSYNGKCFLDLILKDSNSSGIGLELENTNIIILLKFEGISETTGFWL